VLNVVLDIVFVLFFFILCLGWIFAWPGRFIGPRRGYTWRHGYLFGMLLGPFGLIFMLVRRGHHRATLSKSRLRPAGVHEAVLEHGDRRCAYCGSTEDLHLDDIDPTSHGGFTDPKVLQTLCGTCIARKSELHRFG
jgi:hypothetical protein